MAMAARRPRYEAWPLSPQTRIYTRNLREPRDEEVRFPKASRARPTPINIAPGEPSPLMKSSLLAERTSEDVYESTAVPEIVDIAAPNTWPRRGPPKQHSVSKRIASPSMASPCSARQSEISFGILDYYIRDPSPLQSPDFPPAPRIETPVLDPAIEKFDFGLTPNFNPVTPCGTSPQATKPILTVQDASPGAERGARYSQDSMPQPQAPVKLENKPTYRLFPATRQDAASNRLTANNPPMPYDSLPTSSITHVPSHPQPSRPSRPSVSLDPQTPPGPVPASSVVFIPSHPQPDPSYRPRKESLSGSVRSRKDSFTTFCGTRRIPLRILSSSTAKSKARSTMSASNSPADSSSPSQSRWSDETVTSPLVATTPAPRTSFGGLLANDASQYPACFFEDDEDDDEAAPLRRKLRWKRSVSLEEQRRSKPGRFDDRGTFGRRLRRLFLCGCGG